MLSSSFGILFLDLLGTKYSVHWLTDWMNEQINHLIYDEAVFKAAPGFASY